MLEKKEFKGTVFSGEGEGKKFVDLPWVKKQIKEKLGFSPYSGTLNIRLPKQNGSQKMLEKLQGTIINPEKGYCTGKLIKAHIGNLKCAIIIPQIPNYPPDVIEIIAPVNLRESFTLKDGSEVTVTV